MNEFLKRRVPSSGIMLSHPGPALTILFALFAFFMILSSILSGLIANVSKTTVVAIRLSMILQDILIFILPAIATALMATRLPAKLLAINKIPALNIILISVAILFSSMPIMNVIVEWNRTIHFPEYLSEFERVFRQMEDSAQTVIDNLMRGSSVGTLAVSILIIGVMAGFSEELFFRGAMQRIFMSTTMNGHLAVWCVALIFSLFHFQFFGIVPRMLLGAYFGYLLWWSGSLWLPIILHILNNTIVVIFTWRSCNIPDETLNPDKLGVDLSSSANCIMVGVSIIITVLLFVILKRLCNRQN
ncbi:MAG: CPBP family intramembrane metalloprotease [Bacteroidales bacterium]|nr:CPBP family intramembrane metalloprotease [Bacteroidales bacterium]